MLRMDTINGIAPINTVKYAHKRQMLLQLQVQLVQYSLPILYRNRANFRIYNRNTKKICVILNKFAWSNWCVCGVGNYVRITKETKVNRTKKKTNREKKPFEYWGGCVGGVRTPISHHNCTCIYLLLLFFSRFYSTYCKRNLSISKIENEVHFVGYNVLIVSFNCFFSFHWS